MAAQRHQPRRGGDRQSWWQASNQFCWASPDIEIPMTSAAAGSKLDFGCLVRGESTGVKSEPSSGCAAVKEVVVTITLPAGERAILEFNLR